MALLEIENLHVSYGSVEVLHGISLHVDEGEIVTLLGANGAGKSTTLLSISRLVNPREGRITFDGKNLLDYESYQVVGLGVAQSPEGRRVFGTMTVQENLMLGAFQVHSETIKQNTLEWIFSFSPSPGAPLADGGHAFRRRTADAGHGPGPHGPAEAPAP